MSPQHQIRPLSRTFLDSVKFRLEVVPASFCPQSSFAGFFPGPWCACRNKDRKLGAKAGKSCSTCTIICTVEEGSARQRTLPACPALEAAPSQSLKPCTQGTALPRPRTAAQGSALIPNTACFPTHPRTVWKTASVEFHGEINVECD